MFSRSDFFLRVHVCPVVCSSCVIQIMFMRSCSFILVLCAWARGGVNTLPHTARGVLLSVTVCLYLLGSIRI